MYRPDIHVFGRADALARLFAREPSLHAFPGIGLFFPALPTLFGFLERDPARIETHVTLSNGVVGAGAYFPPRTHALFVVPMTDAKPWAILVGCFLSTDEGLRLTRVTSGLRRGPDKPRVSLVLERDEPVEEVMPPLSNPEAFEAAFLKIVETRVNPTIDAPFIVSRLPDPQLNFADSRFDARSFEALLQAIALLHRDETGGTHRVQVSAGVAREEACCPPLVNTFGLTDEGHALAEKAAALAGPVGERMLPKERPSARREDWALTPTRFTAFLSRPRPSALELAQAVATLARYGLA